MDGLVIPRTNSREYRLLGYIYDIIIILLSTVDTLTNIFVLVELGNVEQPSLVVEQFKWILIIWFFSAQGGLMLFWASHFEDCNCDITCAMMIVAPLIPIIHYFLGYNHEIFQTDDNDPFLKQFCTILRNRDAGFIIQSLIESLPSAIVQTFVLIYQSNDNVYYSDTLQFWLCISITTTFITLIIKMLVLIDWTHITNKWLVFNYLCVMTDIASFFTAVIWIFYDNNSLFCCMRGNHDDDNFNLSDILTTFFANMHDNIPAYQSAWIYSALIGIVPTLCIVIVIGTCAALVCSIPYIAFIFCKQCEDWCQLILSTILLVFSPLLAVCMVVFCIFGLLIITILAQFWCWSGIGLLLFDLNKFIFQTKYDTILWNHFLCQSKIFKEKKIRVIIAINYSLLRKETTYDDDVSMSSRRLRNYLKKKAKSEITMIKNQQKMVKRKRERLKRKLNHKIKAIKNSIDNNYNRCSINDSDSKDGSIHINAQSHKQHNYNYDHDYKYDYNYGNYNYHSLDSTLINTQENEIKQNEQIYRQQLRMIYTHPMNNVDFAKLRYVSYSSFGKKIENRLVFVITLLHNISDHEWFGCLVGVCIELVSVVPYLLSRLIVILFPWILLFVEVIPKIVASSDNDGIEGYYKNEVMNNNLNMYKHLLLWVTLICYLIMVLLLVFHVIPMFYYCYHILPGDNEIPHIYSRHTFEYVFMDIYACYNVLFVSRVREYYIFDRFGNDIGMIILEYLGIGKQSERDIESLIDELNPKIGNKSKYDQHFLRTYS